MKRFLTVLLGALLALATLAARPAFKPFPKAGDPFWRRQVPATMRHDYIRLGNQYVDGAWETIPDSLFAEFRTNGNRTRYEAASFGVRRQFACLAMAEIMEHEGRFLPALRRGLHYFMEQEPWWGIPAHYPKAKPERDIQPVDLFNAETAAMLAWTLYMLADDIDRGEPGLCDSVRSEIERRFLRPVLYEEQGWKNNANNWNTWITGNWLETVLICEKDDAQREAAFQGVKQCLRTFLKGYPDDGACEEGVAYWDCAGASFFESLFFMQYAPDEAVLTLDAAEERKVAAMGRFITAMHIADLTFVNFSDAQARYTPNINILFPYGAYLGDEGMMQLAAYVGKAYRYLEQPSTLFLQSGNYPRLGRELMLLSMLPQFRKTPAVQPQTADAFLANSQIMVARSKDWFVAAKGGNNAESHNHNDVGTFIVYHRNKPVVIDLGRDTYTSLSFSSRRFELTNCRSAFHNVPLVNGAEQRDGRAFRATEVAYVGGEADTASPSVLQLNLENAYPAEAQVQTWQRRLTLDRAHNQVVLTDSFDITPTQRPTELVLMVYGQPTLRQLGKILLQDGQVCLAYDARTLEASVEQVQMADGIMKTQWNDNVWRIALRLKGDGAAGGHQTRITLSADIPAAYTP